MSPKVFRVVSGYEVVKGYVTYGAGLALDVESGETIRVFPVRREGNAPCIGLFSYEDLDATPPPAGLAPIE